MKQKKEETPTTGDAVAVEEKPVVSRMRAQYTASSRQYSFFLGDRALPQSIDDVERDFHLPIYDEMHHDAILHGCIAMLKTRALADAFSIGTSIDDPDPDTATDEEKAFHKEASVYADFIRRNIDSLQWTDRPLLATLYEMLDCLYKGHRFAEVNYRLEEEGEDAGLLVLDSIKTKPRENYTFVMSRFNSLIGIQAKIPSVSIALRTGILWNPAEIPNVISPEKAFILTLGGSEGNPQGDSLYRAAYDPWWRKKTGKVEDVKTIVQFAGGMITAELGPEAPEEVIVDGVAIDVRDHVAAGLAELYNGGVYVAPRDVKITIHRPGSDGNYFDDYNDRCNREMATAVIIAARTLLESKHGSKADTGTSQDLTDEFVRWIRQLVCDALRKVFYNLIKTNFGVRIARKFTPRMVMSSSNQPDLPALLTGLSAIGYEVAPSQMRWWDRKVGVRERTDAEVGILQKRFAADPAEQADPQAAETKPGLKFKKGGKFDNAA